ncbi:SusC/RagA family TonB-linked outer membrane protein [Bacteroidota bacterium]
MRKILPCPFLIVLILIMSFVQLSAQLNVQGIITDNNGIPIPLANVWVVGTNYGAASDMDGNYSLTITAIPEGGVIIEVRYVGFKTERETIEVTSGTVELNFELLMDILEMDQVVKTGIADAVPKKKLGHSISTVHAKELEKSGSSQIDAALSGKIPGALVQVNSGNPGGGTSIRLRGLSTLYSGTSDPLYIIDGVIIDNSALPLIDIGGNSSNRLADLDPNDVDRIEVVKGAAAAALFGSRANNGVIQIFTKRGTAGDLRVRLTTTAGFDQIVKKLDFVDYPYALINNVLTPVTRYDYQDDIFQIAPRYSTNLSLSGGDAATRYYLSGSWNNQEGIIKSSEYTRESVRFNLDRVMSDWLNVSLSTNYVHSINYLVGNGGVGTLVQTGFGPLTGLTQMRNYDNLYPDANGVYPLHPWRAAGRANPLDVINNWSSPEEIDRFIGGIKFDITPLPGMSVQYRFGYDTYTQSWKLFIPRISSQTTYENGFSQDATKRSYLFNSDLDVTYTAEITPGIVSMSAVGMNYQDSEYDIINSSTQDLTPLIEIISGSAEYDAISEYIDKRRTLGFYFQETFSLYDKLFVTGAIRADAASTFGENERWQIFPKFSASYLMSEENFWQDNLGSVVNSFKLRAALGYSGGQPVGSFDRLSNFATTTYDGQTGLVNSILLGNDDLKPERMREWEVGIDFELLESIVGVELTYFDKQVEDLIISEIINPSTGFESQLQNVGILVNDGIELLVRGVIFDEPDFNWTATGTFATNNPIIDKLYGEEIRTSLSWSMAVLEEGKPPTTFYRELIDWTSVDANGLPTAETAFQHLGDPNPDYIWAFTNEFRLWDDLNIRIMFDAQMGFEVFNWDMRSARHTLWQWHPDYEAELKGELPAGYNNKLAGALGEFVEDASFIKCREVSATYTMKNDFLRSFGLRNVQFTLTGRNLFTITDYTGYDPETNAGGQHALYRGWDWATMPIPRSIIFSLTLNIL